MLKPVVILADGGMHVSKHDNDVMPGNASEFAIQVVIEGVLGHTSVGA